MIDTELLNSVLEDLYPEDLEGYQEKRDIFKAGVQWGYNHPYFNKGCPDRVWHYLTDNPNDLPDPYKICLIKFSDGTGGISSLMMNCPPNVTHPDNPDFNNTKGKTIEDGIGDDEIGIGGGGTPIIRPESPSGLTGDCIYYWTTKYRDDIVAWSYYVL